MSERGRETEGTDSGGVSGPRLFFVNGPKGSRGPFLFFIFTSFFFLYSLYLLHFESK
jgi:hypothetical protein